MYIAYANTVKSFYYDTVGATTCIVVPIVSVTDYGTLPKHYPILFCVTV